MVYIRLEKLPKLKEYKYAGVDHSLLSRYVLKPFYSNVAIKLFPLSMAPNAITLTGFGFVIINFLTLLWYNPTLDQDCPPWVYASWAIGLFLYQTFDAVDGTQARRTGQSGPLGELFDHGVDALNTTLEVLLFAGATNMGQSWKTVLTLFGCLFTFYIQTWDEYHTKTLTLGLISGPVEGITTLCVLYAFTAVKGGGSYWQQSLLQTIGVPPYEFIPKSIYKLTWTESWMFYGGLVLVFNTFQSAQNVLKARRARNQNPYRGLLGLVPALWMWTLVPTYLYLRPQILYYHLVPFSFYVGLINAYSVGQIIIAHLTKSRFAYQNVLLLPLVYGVLDSLGPVILSTLGASGYTIGGFSLPALNIKSLHLHIPAQHVEKYPLGWPSALGPGYQVPFVFACLGLSVGVYGSFVVDVILAICEYLDIWCLSIKHPGGELKERNERRERRRRAIGAGGNSGRKRA